ncbi:hypothetical protein ACKO6X_002807 [Enterococcus hirae]|uniref:hypothetical protein n=1 Tax=Enterococcus hirae TaxID=1354 RepID=UPI000FFB7702|nr:hypothetical protein [Enterococcus hirae]EMF0511846.1 hypothetical protein [Enterococcus hirae]EMF0517533.1 hypothetical protein [Enterococcus hirae]MCA6767675.1 hypothetical protein [Enterococcus hirae]
MQIVKQEKWNLEQKQKELEKEKRTIEAQVSKVKQAENEVKQELAEARKKEQEAEEYIDKRVAIIKKEIQMQSEESLKEAEQKAKLENSITSYALSGYTAVLTLVWAINQWTVIKTLPQWFLNRWENIKTVWQVIQAFFFWLVGLFPKDWYEFIRYFIPLVILGILLAYTGFSILSMFSRLISWYQSGLRNCYDRAEFYLKKAMVFVISGVSLLVSVLLSRVFPNGVHFFSYFLIFSFLGNALYLEIGEFFKRY